MCIHSIGSVSLSLENHNTEGTNLMGLEEFVLNMMIMNLGHEVQIPAVPFINCALSQIIQPL